MRNTEAKYNAIDKALDELTNSISLNEATLCSIDAISNAVLTEYHLQRELNNSDDAPISALKALADKVFALCELAKASLRIADACN